MISFDLSEEQKIIRDTVAAFARDEIRPAARPADESGTIPDALVAQGWELGLVRGAMPEVLGGESDARSAVTGAIVAEELGYGDVAIAAHMLAPRLFAFPVLEMGTEEQRKTHLAPLCGAAFAPATAALMEPRFDFDLTAMETTAESVNGEIKLSGRKCCVPLARESKSILVYAAGDRGAGFAGVGAYIVAREVRGVTVSPREKNMGLKGLATYEVVFDGCIVPAGARVGGERGVNFSRLMSEGRIALGALGVGLMRAAFDYARDYAKERKAFGAPIATRQAIAFILADMAIEIDAARLLIWEAAARLDKGDDALPESYLAKNYVAASALRVADNGVQVLGGHGYIREHPVEMWLRNARGLAVMEGLATV